jgi:hypothetical protein
MKNSYLNAHHQLKEMNDELALIRLQNNHQNAYHQLNEFNSEMR